MIVQARGSLGPLDVPVVGSSGSDPHRGVAEVAGTAVVQARSGDLPQLRDEAVVQLPRYAGNGLNRGAGVGVGCGGKFGETPPKPGATLRFTAAEARSLAYEWAVSVGSTRVSRTLPWAWIAVMATVLMMSATRAPRDRSLIGLLRPCSTGPMATAFALRCTAL